MGLPWSLANTIASGASVEMFFEDLLVRGAESPVPLINSFMGLLFNCPMKNFMEILWKLLSPDHQNSSFSCEYSDSGPHCEE